MHAQMLPVPGVEDSKVGCCQLSSQGGRKAVVKRQDWLLSNRYTGLCQTATLKRLINASWMAQGCLPTLNPDA